MVPRVVNKSFARKPDLILQLSQQICHELIDDSSDEEGPNPVLRNTEVVQWNMHVSSMHLTEASPFFDTLLNGGFSESTITTAGNVRQIPLLDVDPKAFELLMQILHLRHNNSQRELVGFDTLFQLCVQIDMYSLQEQASIFSNRWFARLSSTITTDSKDELERRIFIAYVLGQSEIFEELTSTHLQERSGPTHFSGIPLPAHVQEDQQHTHEQATHRCINSLQALLMEYEDSRSDQCRQGRSECDALVLGCLIRKLRQMELYPPSTDYFETSTLSRFMQFLTNYESSTLCKYLDEQEYGKYHAMTRGRGCGLRDRLSKMAVRLDEDTIGISVGRERDGGNRKRALSDDATIDLIRKRQVVRAGQSSSPVWSANRGLEINI